MGNKYLENILKTDWLKEPEQQLEEKRSDSTPGNLVSLYDLKREACSVSAFISLFTFRDHKFFKKIVETNDPIPQMSHLSNGCKDTFVLCDVLWDSLENVLHED